MDAMRWNHKPRRIPDLDRSDLETIVLLVREYGNQNLPVFSARLMRKIEESLTAYRWEDGIIRKESTKFPSLITWPPGTEKYSHGPSFG